MIWNNKKIKAAWERYVKGAESIPEQVEGVRTEILDPGCRSQGSADPFAQESTILSPSEAKRNSCGKYSFDTDCLSLSVGFLQTLI